MAESAVSFLLNHLSVWLQEELKLLGVLRDEIEMISGLFQQMRAFLRVADAREETDPQLKEWVRQVREIAYEIEDVLESYMLESHVRRPSRGIRGHIKKLIHSPLRKYKAKRNVAYEIKALRSKAEGAFSTYSHLSGAFSASNSSYTSSNIGYDGRGDARLLEEAEVLGIERPKKQLLSWISIADHSLQVIAVVGTGGLGKTTLVKKVYDDSLVKEKFNHHVWINVSETYNIENLLRDMIKKLLDEVKQPLPSTFESMNADDMRESIYNFLQYKKYIIVLDDIWRKNVWEALWCAFPRSTSSSDGRGCIIITSRYRNIGGYACRDNGGHIYDMQPLPKKEAEKLFYRKAFGRDSCPPYLKEISADILRRCGGLPLAIVVIGGVLATKGNAIEEWRMFSHNFGSELEEDNRLGKVISLSYYDLPYHLKTCLLFLSVFPEDYLVERTTITRLWIAEGFVERKEGRTMEEIAEGYLNELCNRSMIQIAEMTWDGQRPKKYRIHDLVREYIISKAREQRLAFVKSERGTAWDDRIRWLTLDDSISYNTEQIGRYKCLRALLFFGSRNSEWRSIICSILHGGCRMLKELDLRGAPLNAIPDEVFTLYGLKYLSFKDTKVSVVPKSIGNLEKLETLDLKGCHVVELPVEIIKLKRLRYLSVYSYGDYIDGDLKFDNVRGFKAPYEIGELSHLQKLCYIDANVNTEIVKEIGRLKELRRLGIVTLRMEDGKNLCSSLTNLSYLSSLIICSFGEDEVIDVDYHMPPNALKYLQSLVMQGRLEKVPQWIPSLNALKSLILRWSKMVEDPLEFIQNLPNLEILELRCAFEGEGLNFRSGGFPRLTVLYLFQLRGLKWVRVEKGSMLNLKRWDIYDCRAMREVPVGVEYLTHLEVMWFTDTAEELVEKMIEEKKMNGDEWKLAHCPIIEIWNWVDREWRYRRV